jgi:DNA repair protein RecO (recombination protein O)
MPLRETEAIVLRTYRLGEADKIVSFFTRQFGRLRAAATGAQRPKSRYGGSLEPLSYVRLWLFDREGRDLLRLNSAELIESFFDMQKDYRVQIAVQFLVEVSERILPEREVNERAFRLLLAVGRALKRSGELDRPLVYFDYWLLRLAGFLPDLERCGACGKMLGDRPGYYGRGSEGILCAECRVGRTGFAPRSATAAALGLAAGIRRAPLDQWLAGETPADAVRELRLLLEELLESHAEKKFVTRELLNEEDVE